MAATRTLIHVESMQTAVPARVAGPGRSLPIAVSGPLLTAAALQRRFRAVLYYRGVDGAEQEKAARARLERAAWVKVSLSAALADHPELTGRLRRRGGGDGQWEVKLNDNGVRLVQASVDTTVAAFLESKEREKEEAALAMWTDVDVQEPEICAPFFIQLTQFQDDGYAIGASCSLLLTDPLSLVKFLKSWARTHAQLQAQSKLIVNPVIQYTRYIQSPDATKRLKSVPLDAYTAVDSTTVLFRAAVAPDSSALAVACVDQAAEMLGIKKPSRFMVLAGDGSGGLNVQTWMRGDGETPPPSRGHALRAAYWHEVGLEEVVLEGSKPVHVSYNIVSPCAEEGLAVLMPAGGAELLISATVLN